MILDLNHQSGLVYGRAAHGVADATARINAHVDAALVARNQQQRPRDYLGGSRIGDACARKLVYEVVHTPKDAGRDFDAIEREIHARNLKGLTQPLTVIYSDRDGIVGPDIAIDIYNPQARNVKVDATHLGLGIAPRVWRIIADTLAGKS